ncbi:hypothetical protein [Dysosmobacter sp.]|uniref:hypothetical protein n=1 Tax=Dysosmobacter sp. TaxID=2591382 RepID=UPI002A90559B|nr:hypothetical protein [Dysosmobacter sp.]MDY3281669.1 hypothetical protein [Dysosmobacter sp.]
MKIPQENSRMFRENTQKIAAFFGLSELYLLQDSSRVTLPDNFPSKTTLHKFVKKEGAELPTLKTVNSIADFCNKTFSFTIPLTAEDLLTRPLGELHPLSDCGRQPEDEKWLSGTLFCYYCKRDYTEDPKKGQAIIQGGLLHLAEKPQQGIRKAWLVMGFTDDGQMRQAAGEIFGTGAEDSFFPRYRRFRDRAAEPEKSIYFFEGTFRDSLTLITGELKKRSAGPAARSECLSLFLHGHPFSHHKRYRGGLAMALRFVPEHQLLQSFRFGISAHPLDWTAPQLPAMLISGSEDTISVDYKADNIWFRYALKKHDSSGEP